MFLFFMVMLTVEESLNVSRLLEKAQIIMNLKSVAGKVNVKGPDRRTVNNTIGFLLIN